jgi:hypothetical protein
MPKPATLLADHLPHARQANGADERLLEPVSASLSGWFAEIVALIPKQTRKAVRNTIRKAVSRHGPEIATAIITGVVTSLLTATSTAKGKKKKKKKKR